MVYHSIIAWSLLTDVGSRSQHIVHLFSQPGEVCGEDGGSDEEVLVGLLGLWQSQSSKQQLRGRHLTFHAARGFLCSEDAPLGAKALAEERRARAVARSIIGDGAPAGRDTAVCEQRAEEMCTSCSGLSLSAACSLAHCSHISQLTEQQRPPRPSTVFSLVRCYCCAVRWGCGLRCDGATFAPQSCVA